MAKVMMDSEPYLRQFKVPLGNRGKVRETYDLGGGRLLIVATDRISAFDVVLPTGIRDKGVVLTALTKYWLTLPGIMKICPNHLIEVVDDGQIPGTGIFCPEIAGRSMVVEKASRRLDAECIVRGYITGSHWAKYEQSNGPVKGAVIAGVEYPSGLGESQQLPKLLFTPTTKAEKGHDEDISWEEFVGRVGSEEDAVQIRENSLALYTYARDYARQRGVIIADTKFEFGWVGGEIVLIDEVLTPDSSRFWPASQFEPGRPQLSFDKQFVRDYLIDIGWDRQPPAPELRPEIAEKTSEKYREAQRLLAGSLI